MAAAAEEDGKKSCQGSGSDRPAYGSEWTGLPLIEGPGPARPGGRRRNLDEATAGAGPRSLIDRRTKPTGRR